MAYKLTFTGESESKTADLTAELSVGRTNLNDVVLNDQGVSRKHCRFFVGDDGMAYVEDLGSANGVQVDGVAISEPTPVGSDSTIYIGKTLVKVENTASRGSRGARGGEGGSALARREPGAGAISRRSERRGREESQEIESADSSRKRSGDGRASSRAVAPRASRAVKATARGKLKCTAGALEGQVFDLGSKPRMVIGRVPPADIVIKDMSVARKHAEIYKVGSCYNIYDLGSPNGTKVNGEAITETQLCPGDEIVIGDFTFQYTGPGDARQNAGGMGKGKLIGLGVIGLVLVGIVAFAFIDDEGADEYQEPTHVSKPITGVSKSDDKVDPIRLLGRCKALADIEGEQLNFKEAEQVCNRVLELDPSLTEARTLARLATKELKFDGLLSEAKLKSSTSQDEAAIDLLLQIEPDSFVFTQARQLFRETSERLAKRMRTQCITEYSSGYYKQAYDACLKQRELTCNTDEPDSVVVKNFNAAAKRTKNTDTFVCPEKYKVFGSRVVYDDSNIEKAIQRMYPNKTVGKLMVEYYTTGRAKKISDDLKRAKAKNPKAFDASVDELILKLEVIDGRYTSGQEGILRKDATRAEQYWKDAFEAESVIMPQGIDSALVREMKSQLARIYFDVGQELMAKEHYADAFKKFFQGYQYDPKNRDLLEKIAWLEAKAQNLVKENDCGSVQLAADITMPKSSINKRAKDRMDEMGCY